MKDKFVPNPTLFRVKKYVSNSTKAGRKMTFVQLERIGLKLENGSIVLIDKKELTSKEISAFTKDEKKKYLIIKKDVRKKSENTT